MATSDVKVSEGVGKNVATYSITEDTETKQIQRVVLNDPAGALNGVLGKVGADHTTPGVSDSWIVSSAQLITVSGTITNGTSLSASIDLSSGRLAGILVPSAWTAANLTFQASPDNATFGNMRDITGAEYTVNVVAASDFIEIPVGDFLGIRYLKVRSGTSSAAVNQGADRAVTFVLVP